MPVLLVAESGPMVGLSAQVEAALRDAGVAPLVRMQTSGVPGTVLSDGNRTTISFRDPKPSPEDLEEIERMAAASVAQADRLAVLTGTDGEEMAVPMAIIVQGLFRGSIARQRARVRYAANVLDALSPKLLVVGNDRWWGGQAFTRLARARGVTSVCVQDGLDSGHPVWAWFSADYLATSGTNLIAHIERFGFDVSRCRATGQPRYDALPLNVDQATAKKAARERLGLDSDAFYVLVAAQTDQDSGYVHMVLGAVMAVAGTRVILRPHPSSPKGLFDAVAERYPSGRLQVHASADPVDAVRAADVVISQHSTVAVEAALLGTPAITANFGGLPDPIPFVPLGISMGAWTPAQLTQAVAEMLDMGPAGRSDLVDRARAGTEALIGPADGGAASRVATFITEILAK